MDLFRTLLVFLAAFGLLVAATPARQQRHHREYDDEDEDNHYLPPETHELKPFFRKDKHNSEHVVYRRREQEAHHEPKRVDHYHHYDKMPQVKTEHIHYQQHNPQLHKGGIRIRSPRTRNIVGRRRRRPSRLVYATAPNSVFHTQINVQSQDSELNSRIRADPLRPVGQLAGSAQAPAGPRFFDPLADQLGAGGLAPFGGQLPGNGLASGNGFIAASGQLLGNGLTPGDGQLSVNRLAPGGGQLPVSRVATVGGQLPAIVLTTSGGQLSANGVTPVGGQLPGNGVAAVGRQLSGNGLALSPGQLPANRLAATGAQLPAVVLTTSGGQSSANGVARVGGQLSVNGLAPAGRQLAANGFPLDRQLAVNLSNGQGTGNDNQNVRIGQNLFTPASGAQLLVGTQPARVNGGQAVAQRPSSVLVQIDPAFAGQLPASTAGNRNQQRTTQAPVVQQTIVANRNPPLGRQLVTGAQALENASSNQVVAFGRANGRQRNGRQRNRSNYQGLNVVRGNVYGLPDVQGPTNAVGNQQDTNIIDGNFYSMQNGEQRSILVTDGDYYDDDDTDGIQANIGLAGSAPELAYAKPEHKGSRHRASQDQATAASAHQERTYQDDGYHYKNPRHTK